MTDLTEEQMARLPRWAQEHIRELRIYRIEALRTVNNFLEQQEATKVWFTAYPCTGEQRGPRLLRRYLQTDKVVFGVGNSELEVSMRGDLLEIRSVGLAESMNIEPISNNSIAITCLQRRRS